MFILLGFCLGWSSNFVGSESGQIQSLKLLKNMISNRTQHLPPLPFKGSVGSCRLTIWQYFSISTGNLLHSLTYKVFYFHPSNSAQILQLPLADTHTKPFTDNFGSLVIALFYTLQTGVAYILCAKILIFMFFMYLMQRRCLENKRVAGIEAKVIIFLQPKHCLKHKMQANFCCVYWKIAL
jgi:hypothetical protein